MADRGCAEILCARSMCTCARSALPHFFKFVKATFCILVSSTLIESCFAVFQALKGKDRSSLGDGRVLEALLSREAVDVQPT